jgi:3',5'-nucleoside bisphosphate phosphatase
MHGKIDLHTHSSASDGHKSPVELIDYARTQGLEALAITDHDTIDGLSPAIEYAHSINFDLIPGVEFSIDFPQGRNFHMIGLFVDITCKELIDGIEELQKFRRERAPRMIADLRKAGIDITLDEVYKEADGASLGKPHFARVMIRKGYAADFDDVFNRFLADGKPGDVYKVKIGPEEAINLIRRAGGLPFIAHPVTMRFQNYHDFEKYAADLKNKGLAGIEAYSTEHTLDQVSEYCAIAGKLGLLLSGGSDYHGNNGIVIGDYSPGKPIPFEILEEIQAHRAR